MSRAAAAALRTILPTELETRLLRCLLHEGPVAERAWSQFHAAGADVVELLRHNPGLRRLGPKLSTALGAAGLRVDAEARARLRSAYVHERLRAERFREICAEALRRIRAAGASVIVLKGAAFGEELYGDAALRHSHDLELLVRDSPTAAAGALVDGATFRCGPSSVAGEIAVVHSLGLPVTFRRRLFRSRHGRAQRDQLWEHSRPARIAGVEACVLSPEDNLLHVLGHAAFSRTRSSLVWACDAWLLIHRHSDLNWERFLANVRSGGLGLPLSVLLPYLGNRLDAPVPRKVLGELRTARAGASRAERDAALWAARSARGFRQAVSAAGGWPARLSVAATSLVPSAEYLRRAYGVTGSGELLVRRMRRAVRGLRRGFMGGAVSRTVGR